MPSRQRACALVRFADDFVLLCKDEDAAEAAHERIAGLLREQGLRLEPEKTRIVGFDQHLRFLGHLFVRSMALKEVSLDDGTGELPPPAVLGRALDPDDDGDDAFGPAGEPRGERAPGLRVLYVTEPGRALGLRNESFVVREEGEEIFAVQPGPGG